MNVNSLSMKKRTEKLQTLADDYGMTIMGLLEEYQIDSVAPGICIKSGCSYTTEYEPDSEHGWCEECGTGTVVSAFVLADLI
jgi:hypothetical protein